MTSEEAREKKELDDAEAKGPTLQEILVPIWANRKRILIISFAVAVVTLAINFLFLPLYYKSIATLLPETQKDKLSSLGQFADIANFAGVSVPGSEIARLYPTIISSETVLRSVIVKKYKTQRCREPVDLIKYFELEEATDEKNMDKAVGQLRGLISSSFDNKTSVVSISLEMQEPQLAADVLNAVIDELDSFMRYKRFTNASEQVRWIDVRITEVQRDLREAEEALKGFRERNRRIIDSPQLVLEEGRLARDVQVKSTIFVELKKQYELAKLEEIKNITIVNVLDRAKTPVKKERPKRATNAAIMFLLVFFGSSSYYAVRSVYGEALTHFVKALGRPALVEKPEEVDLDNSSSGT
jgi:uncharacterized protein involved in exopolysaccharide biosynthesis